MVELRPSRSSTYTPAERAWWTFCLFTSAYKFTQINTKARQYLQIEPGSQPTEDDVLRTVVWVRENYPISWVRINKEAQRIQLAEVAKRASTLISEKGVDFSDSTRQAEKELSLEYDESRPKRHRVLQELETLLFQSYDRLIASQLDVEKGRKISP
ncbi:MAG: hypothetical protein AAB875_00115 [Patescibacteria group bacterium]